MARFVVVGEVATPTLCDPGAGGSRSEHCYNPGISEACEAKLVVVEELATHCPELKPAKRSLTAVADIASF